MVILSETESQCGGQSEIPEVGSVVGPGETESEADADVVSVVVVSDTDTATADGSVVDDTFKGLKGSSLLDD